MANEDKKVVGDVFKILPHRPGPKMELEPEGDEDFKAVIEEPEEKPEEKPAATMYGYPAQMQSKVTPLHKKGKMSPCYKKGITRAQKKDLKETHQSQFGKKKFGEIYKFRQSADGGASVSTRNILPKINLPKKGMKTRHTPDAKF